jgi:site-specific DNA-adenine methylase
MTIYHGGKQRLGREISQCISDAIKYFPEFNIHGYCEPFCGMLGVYQYILPMINNNITYEAGDINESVIEMWKAVKDGWIPSLIYTKDQFDILKYNRECSAEKGYVGCLYTFRVVFFDSYFLHNKGKRNSNRDRIINMKSKIKNIQFSTGEYNQYSDLCGYVIYCDPPYKNATCRYFNGKGYYDKLSFDHDSFWKWCKHMSTKNIVFVSEYSAPDYAIEIWKKDKERLYLVS